MLINNYLTFWYSHILNPYTYSLIYTEVEKSPVAILSCPKIKILILSPLVSSMSVSKTLQENDKEHL